MAANKYYVKIKENGCCYKSVLEQLTKAELVAMGLPIGHATLVYDKIFPKVGTVIVQALRPSAITNMKTEAVPAFPTAGKTGLPSLRGLKAWMPKVYVALKQRGVSVVELKTVFAAAKEVRRRTSTRAG